MSSVLDSSRPSMVGGNRCLAMHVLGDGRLLVTRFLTRFGEVVWMIDDLTRSDEDPCGLGVEVFQGALSGAKARLRALLGRERAR
jgi:hypothetical protein